MRKPTQSEQESYDKGKFAAQNEKSLSRKTISSIKNDGCFWKGFHNNRPNSFDKLQTIVLEDPTRPSGFVYNI